MTKHAFLSALEAESARAVFIASKLTSSELDYRPTERSRSTIELLRYLTYAGIGVTEALVTAKYDHFKDMHAEAEAVGLAEFPAAMESQLEAIRTMVKNISDADWTGMEVMLPWEEPRTLCDAMVESTLAFYTAYRMQLFLHAKQNGHEDFTTHECWAAKDRPAPTNK